MIFKNKAISNFKVFKKILKYLGQILKINNMNIKQIMIIIIEIKNRKQNFYLKIQIKNK